MTYCLAIQLHDGIVFASDSRTSAGVDHVTTYRKMHVFDRFEDRIFVLLSAGNLATTQEVLSRIQRDLETDRGAQSLGSVPHLSDAARYVGELSHAVQSRYAAALEKVGQTGEVTFIVGGQIRDQPQDIHLVYPQGNFISASPDAPYLQIGETKYGKPILDRVIVPGLNLEDAARCALVSIDSTIRSNLSVGPPIELAIYEKGELALSHHLTLKRNSPYYVSLQKHWNQGIRRAFETLPRFDWE
ncbi:MAG: putative proteasome-type protease [Candidatus Binatota bacterium]|jgi:putative proteasome-type protease|nr:putative proteasome-type protease [Candidatus Binatota bacterium]